MFEYYPESAWNVSNLLQFRKELHQQEHIFNMDNLFINHISSGKNLSCPEQ